MRKKINNLILLLHCVVFGFSQQLSITSYESNSIPEELKKEAKAVFRLDEAVLDISSASKYTLKVHQIITVLNSEGAEHLQQNIWFDKFNKVDDIQVKLYNRDGTELHKYTRKDFFEQSYYDGISLATDDKMMHLNLSATDYPCTIDVTYQKSVSSYIDLPNWYMDNTASSIEQFRFIVKVPAELDIRYRTVNLEIQPLIKDIGTQKVYTWETQHVAVKKLEVGGYEGAKYLPQVAVSPNQFEYDGYKGDFTNWSTFGKWNYNLYEEKNPFTEARSAEIKAMVEKLPDVDSKVKVLYDYLQKNMRYVSIQFGIGGFKPFAAKFVDDKKYGDCKALTNYMRSLLTVAGIKSYPALINAGYNKVRASADFPESIFNHVILCIPNVKDSIWLECTSNSNEAGFLGNFTENKNALLLTENGGFLVQTPASNYRKNLLSTATDIFLNEDGSANVTQQIHATGDYYQLLYQINKMEKSRRTELFVRYLDFKEPDEFALQQEEEFSEKNALKVKSNYSHLFDFKAGDKFFFPKSVNSLCNEKLQVYSSRKSDYLFEYPFTKTDTTVFHLPTSFKSDDLPKDKDITEGPIQYSRKVSYDASSNTVKLITTLLLKNSVVSAKDYESVSVAINAIEKEEKAKLVLQK